MTDRQRNRQLKCFRTTEDQWRFGAVEQHSQAAHLTAEYCIKTMARERIVDEWKLRATRPDNHWLDCLVGCAVAASIQGAVIPGIQTTSMASRGRLRLSEIQRSRQ